MAAAEMSQQDAATAAALAAMFLAPGQDPDERVTVINVETGVRLSGSKAPRRQDLPMWLISHPNYLPDESEIMNLALKQSQLSGMIEQQQQESANRSSRSGKSLRQSHMSTPHDDDESMSPQPASRQQQAGREKAVGRPGSDSSANRAEQSPANGGLQAAAVILFNKNTGRQEFFVYF